jgi:hypothetical protein
MRPKPLRTASYKDSAKTTTLCSVSWQSFKRTMHLLTDMNGLGIEQGRRGKLSLLFLVPQVHEELGRRRATSDNYGKFPMPNYREYLIPAYHVRW